MKFKFYLIALALSLFSFNQVNAQLPDEVWDLGYSGEGVVIGGQDTGYDWDHEALIDKYRGWDGSSADHNYHWHDAIHAIDDSNSGTNPCGLDSPEPCDDHYHGTHTMGTMVGSAGSTEIGVAPDAKWIGCRNMERGDGTPATYLECFEWFLAPTDLNDQNPDASMAPHVINNSWSCPPSEGCDSSYDFTIMETAITNLQSAGVVVVVSAGNGGSGCSSIGDPPAFYPSSFSVGATNSNDNIASFSSRGPTANYGSPVLKPNVSAPGVSVYSSEPDDTYGTHSGTSMAGPHVAGLVALLISAEPALEGDVTQIENIIEQTALNLTSSQTCGGVDGTEIPNNTYGHGRIDALAAVNFALGNTPLDILSFEGKHLNGINVLYWEIENPVNISHFTVEKSFGNEGWHIVGDIPFVEGEFNYTFEESEPGYEISYYRLRIVDQDGTYNFSRLIKLERNTQIITDLYPNPAANDAIFLSLDSQRHSTVNIKIIGSEGSVRKETSLNFSNSTTLPLSVHDLEPGLYYLIIQHVEEGRLIDQLRFLKI